MSCIKIPAKTFILGEYLALAGGPALLLAHEPCYEMSAVPDSAAATQFHPDSPVAKFVQEHSRIFAKHHLQFHAPEGLRGFGSSTAEVLGAMRWSDRLAHSEAPNTKRAWEDHQIYLQAAEVGSSRPSGYDFLAQWSLEPGFFWIEKNSQTLAKSQWPFADLTCIVVATGAKLATHEHLQKLQRESVFVEELCQRLEPIVIRAKALFESSSVHESPSAAQQFCRCIIEFSGILDELSLVSDGTRALLQVIRVWPGICAAKGCGAMGADAVTLIVENQYLEQISRHLADLSLRTLCAVSR